FYQRTGALLAVFYSLNATDLHFENLIACRDYPVPVDLETLFHPPLPGAVQSLPVADSVLNSGLLPRVRWRDTTGGVDISALGSDAGQITPYTVPRLQNAGKDDMRIVH